VTTKELTTERTETKEKCTPARASRDYKVTVPCLLPPSLCLYLFSVTSVVPQARDEISLGLRPKAALPLSSMKSRTRYWGSFRGASAGAAARGGEILTRAYKSLIASLPYSSFIASGSQRAGLPLS
jgi:hypothetical protein